MAEISINANSSDTDHQEETNIVLVGCTGSGKSATGNSILGRKTFKSMSSFGRVTTICKRQSTVLPDGRILNVIDTPGLFDSSTKRQLVEREIVRCIDMASDGIHAILIVVSLKVRFTKEQIAVVETLKHLFGANIVNYMIVAFTGGDELEQGETLDHHLAHTCPQPLKELLDKCENRGVVFDNKTKDTGKQGEQRQQLLDLIAKTVLKNGGKPYTDDIFSKLKKETAEGESDNSNPDQQTRNAYDEEEIQKRIAAIVQEKLRNTNGETINKLQEELKRVQEAAAGRDREYKETRMEIRRLKEQLVRAQMEEEERVPCPLL